MSTESRNLGEYVSELMTRLAAADPIAFLRLKAVVGKRRARITVDAETIHVAFTDGRLVVTAPGRAEGGERVHGEGVTDRGTVMDLLDGHLEVFEAVLGGRLQVRGGWDDVIRMHHAIEILLDASSRAPALRALESDYRYDPVLRAGGEESRARSRPPTLWPPKERTPAEDVLLARLDLLPEAPDSAI